MYKNQTKVTSYKKTDSGISFNYSKVDNNKIKIVPTLIGVVFGYIIVLLLSFGALYTFISMFAIPINYKVFLSIVCAFSLLTTIIYMLPKKAMLWSLVFVAVNITFFVFYYRKYILSGYSYIKDRVVEEICTSMKWPFTTPSYTFEDSMKKDTTVVLLIISFVLINLVGRFVIRKVNFILGFLITFIFFESGVAFGCVPNHYAFAILLAGWIGLFAMFCSSNPKRIFYKNSKKPDKITITPPKNILSMIGAFMSIIALTTFVLVNLVVLKVGYNRSDNIKAMRTDIKDNTNEFIEELLEGGKNGVLNEGKLYKLETRVINKSKQLTLEMPYNSITYLRGYVGEKYYGDRWNNINENDSYDELYQKYNETGYFPQKLQGMLLDELKTKNSKTEKSAVTVTISNIKKKKRYAYLAYIPSIPENFLMIGESLVAPNNKASYSYTAYLDAKNFDIINNSALYNDNNFLKIIKEYSNYVQNQYTVIPDGLEDINQIVDDLVLGRGYGYSTKANNSIEVASRIRAFLSKNIQYSLSTKKLPKNTDFVNNLIFNTKKGYAPHYATAMAIMLRMADIPSRYVEGYVAVKDDFDSGEKLDNGNCKINLTDANSHAWVEIYETSYGWIPLEATPGFYTDTIYDGFGFGAFNLNNIKHYNLSEKQKDTDKEDESVREKEEIPKNEIDVVKPIEQENKTPEKPILQKENNDSILVILKPIFKILFIIIVFFTSIILLLIIRRKCKQKRFNSIMNSNSKSKKIIKLYDYYNNLLKFEKIENTQKLSYIKFAEKVGSLSTKLSAKKHLDIMRIFLKYRFSNDDISDEEFAFIQKTLVDYKNEFLSTLSKLDKLKFMYINNLD